MVTPNVVILQPESAVRRVSLPALDLDDNRYATAPEFANAFATAAKGNTGESKSHGRFFGR